MLLLRFSVRNGRYARRRNGSVTVLGSSVARARARPAARERAPSAAVDADQTALEPHGRRTSRIHRRKIARVSRFGPIGFFFFFFRFRSSPAHDGFRVADGGRGRGGRGGRAKGPRGATRDRPPAGHCVRRRGAAQQDWPPRLDVLGYTVRAAARRRPAVRAARRRPAALVDRRPQRVRAHAVLHPRPAGPAAARGQAVRVRGPAATHVRGLSVSERVSTRRYVVWPGPRTTSRSVKSRVTVSEFIFIFILVSTL